MPCCVAFGCHTKDFNKNSVPPITFHTFPSDENQRQKWVKAIRRLNWKPSKFSRLCSKHFKEEDFDRTSPFCVKLKKDVVPSIFDGFPEHLKQKLLRKGTKSHKAPDKNIPPPDTTKQKVKSASDKLNELQMPESNVMASLALEYEEEEYNAKDKELTIGLSLGIASIGVEFLGFFTGISMFRTSISLLSIFLHGFACFSTSQWLLHSWQISSYWIIFFICSLLPALIESVTVICSFVGSSKEF